MKAVFISEDQALCPSLKPVPYSIRLSNTGISPSAEEQLRVAFDSMCYTCADVNSCTRNDKGCVINGKCFKHGDKDPSQSCNVCDAKKHNMKWSKRTGGDCGVEVIPDVQEDTSQTTIIL